MDADPKVLLMGEDIGKLGGVFRATEGLQKDFGENRVIDTPLAESGIVGTAIGLALYGYALVNFPSVVWFHPEFKSVRACVSRRQPAMV